MGTDTPDQPDQQTVATIKNVLQQLGIVNNGFGGMGGGQPYPHIQRLDATGQTFKTSFSNTSLGTAYDTLYKDIQGDVGIKVGDVVKSHTKQRKYRDAIDNLAHNAVAAQMFGGFAESSGLNSLLGGSKMDSFHAATALHTAGVFKSDGTRILAGSAGGLNIARNGTNMIEEILDKTEGKFGGRNVGGAAVKEMLSHKGSMTAKEVNSEKFKNDVEDVIKHGSEMIPVLEMLFGKQDAASLFKLAQGMSGLVMKSGETTKALKKAMTDTAVMAAALGHNPMSVAQQQMELQKAVYNVTGDMKLATVAGSVGAKQGMLDVAIMGGDVASAQQLRTHQAALVGGSHEGELFRVREMLLSQKDLTKEQRKTLSNENVSYSDISRIAVERKVGNISTFLQEGTAEENERGVAAAMKRLEPERIQNLSLKFDELFGKGSGFNSGSVATKLVKLDANSRKNLEAMHLALKANDWDASKLDNKTKKEFGFILNEFQGNKKGLERFFGKNAKEAWVSELGTNVNDLTPAAQQTMETMGKSEAFQKKQEPLARMANSAEKKQIPSMYIDDLKTQTDMTLNGSNLMEFKKLSLEGTDEKKGQAASVPKEPDDSVSAILRRFDLIILELQQIGGKVGAPVYQP